MMGSEAALGRQNESPTGKLPPGSPRAVFCVPSYNRRPTRLMLNSCSINMGGRLRTVAAVPVVKNREIRRKVPGLFALPRHSSTGSLYAAGFTQTRQCGRAEPVCDHAKVAWDRLLDHLVGGGRQRLGDGEAEGFSGLEVDDELEFRPTHRQIAGLLAAENAAGIVAKLAIKLRMLGP